MRECTSQNKNDKSQEKLGEVTPILLLTPHFLVFFSFFKHKHAIYGFFLLPLRSKMKVIKIHLAKK